MKIMEEPDRRHFIGFHCDNARAWLKSFAIHTEISVEAFIFAVLAHGSIAYTDGTIDGQVWECGLYPYVGSSVTDGWKHVFSTRPASRSIRSGAAVSHTVPFARFRRLLRIFGFFWLERIGVHAAVARPACLRHSDCEENEGCPRAETSRERS